MIPVDPDEVQKRFDRLGEILGDITSRADAQAASRCPYRDRHDRCTARFGCRNQAALEPDGEPPARDQAERVGHRRRPARVAAADAEDDAPPQWRCTHDGRFDYRRAWETDPAAVDRARQRLRAARRPGLPDSDPPHD